MAVIPAEARIQQSIIKTLDTGSCRRTGETTFYEIISF